MHLHPEALFIIQAFILIGVPFFLWQFKIVKKYTPLVVVQIVLGIFLGPSILGIFYPDAFHFLFPKESLPILSGLAWLALILFGFLTGLHLDLNQIRGKGKSFSIISLSTILVPAVLGMAAAQLLYHPELVGDNANTITYLLGMGIAVGVTALPVLGAILLELNIIHTDLGKKVLSYATVNDVLLWVLVSLLIALASTSENGGNGMVKVITTIVLTFVFVIVMYARVRPFLARLAQKKILTDHPDNKQLVIIFSMIFASALATELIGIHYLLGAFIFGAMFPKEITHGIHANLEKFTSVTLLPFFFMLTGLKTAFDVTSPRVWVVFGIMTVIASVGKIVGTAVPEKIFGGTWYEALRGGVLMQTKGLMEVVVLNIMLSGGIISPIAFSAMLFMAVVTTAMTKPSLIIVDKIFSHETSHAKKQPVAIENSVRTEIQ